MNLFFQFSFTDWSFFFFYIPTGLLCDLLWSDPDKDTNGWGENDRGVSFTFGADVVSKFLNRHDLDLICRAHQVRFGITLYMFTAESCTIWAKYINWPLLRVSKAEFLSFNPSCFTLIEGLALRKSGLETFYTGQFTLSTQLISQPW